MDEMLSLQASSTEESFLSSNWNTNRPEGAHSTSASSPFPFDLHICDYSGGTPISLPLSAAGTPAYADVNDPFFSDFDSRKIPTGLQPAFMREHNNARECDEEGSTLNKEATLRKRALQRLSLTSSVVSSAPSTAPSENEDDANESDWDSLSLKRSDSTAGEHSDPLDSGLYSAFSLHSLAGPCSFNGRESALDTTLNDAQAADGTIRAARRPADDGSDRRGGISALSVFNLSDFISDTEPSPEESNAFDPSQASDNNQPLQYNQGTPHNAGQQIVGIEGLAPNVTAVKVEQYNIDMHNIHATPTRLGARFDFLDLGCSSPAPLSDGAANATAMAPSASTPFLASQNFVGSLAENDQMPKMPQQQRSMSFNNFDAAQMVTPERPLMHPSLLRVGKQETSSRSYSSPNIHDPLSCNPAHITPSGASPAGYGAHHNALSPAFAQNLFGPHSDFPDSPASSALSSPPAWACALSNEEGEVTYRASNSAAAASCLSSSLPIRPSTMRSYSDAYSVPASPSGHAGHPMRPVRSTAGVAPASPYAGPTFGSPVPSQHLLPPSHPLAHLQNPYSGVITKRSRGRRVPSTPEEMTNIGKSGKVYTCKVPGCGKLFKRSEHLKRHIRSIHTNEKPYVCQICLKQFSRHDNLNQHMRVHGSGAGSVAGDSNASSAGESDLGSPLSASPAAPSRRGSSCHSFHETKGGTITRRNMNMTDDGVFDFEQAD
ncbi:unnamed protein product [Sympodiomycopsis kandeliae]